MKKLWCLVVCLVVISGCSINQQFVEAVESAWEAIGPEYIAYVQNDPSLDDDTKTIRQRTANLMDELIAEAKDND